MSATKDLFYDFCEQCAKQHGISFEEAEELWDRGELVADVQKFANRGRRPVKVRHASFDYLRFVSGVEQMAPHRFYVHVGDRFTIELVKCEHDLKDKRDIMNIWKKCGLIAEALPSHWAVNTFFYAPSGDCLGLYNSTVTEGHKLFFPAIVEATEENAKMLIADCIFMYKCGVERVKAYPNLGC